MQDLRAELVESLDEAEWNWLIPHAQRDAVIVVTEQLNIVDVGIALANDNVASVQSWIDEELIHKPSVSQLSDWNSDRTKRFNSLIVQPFVLIQELSA